LFPARAIFHNQIMDANLVVIQFPGSKETVYWFNERHHEALRGELIGVAAICMYSHSHYAISIKGEIRRAPTFTRGLLPEMDYQLGRILRCWP
jgi:hypothetical protein